MDENEISRVIISAAIDVHATLGGPGLLGSVYEEALAYELELHDLNVQRQLQIPMIYKGNVLTTLLRLDLVVERLVVVECKATTQYSNIFEVQTLTYLRASGLRLGLVINFGERLVSRGIHRIVNKL